MQFSEIRFRPPVTLVFSEFFGHFCVSNSSVTTGHREMHFVLKERLLYVDVHLGLGFCEISPLKECDRGYGQEGVG